jgi:cell division protein FtsW
VKWWRFLPLGDRAVKDWTLEARLLHWLTLVWLGLGMVVLFSASFPVGLAEAGDGLYFFKRQLIWLALGWGGFQVFIRLPLRRSLQMAIPGFFLFLLLIWATRLPGVGSTMMGATRWISVGPVQIQPSEMMKPFLVLQAAWVFSSWRRLHLKARCFWLSAFALTLVGILIQPNLSTTALCGMSLWLVALGAGLPLMPLSMTAISGVGLAVLSISINDYQRRRVMSFLDPWSDAMGDGYQLVQSLLAVASGGVFGSGYGFSQQKLAYLPIQHTDFIFSIYAEEMGLVGCLFLLALLAAYGYLGMRVVHQCREPVVQLIALGATVIMLLQALINMGVAIGILPTTGLPFPLFSYGGSSIMASLAIAGLLIRSAREAHQATILPLPTSINQQTRTPTVRTRRRATPVTPLRPQNIPRYKQRKL